MDNTIGMILDKVDDLGIADNTYILYTADHGSPGRSNGPLARGKGTVWEGGLRVPFFIRGPGIKPGSLAQTRVTGADLFPTVVELAQVEQPLPEGIEGGSLVPVLRNQGKGSVKRAREELVFHFPHYDNDAIGPASAILLGNYKLIRVYENDTSLLFDLEKDIGERRDLTREMPDKVAELNGQLTEYLKSVNAQMPTQNLNFDPSNPPADERTGGNRRKRDRRGRDGNRRGTTER